MTERASASKRLEDKVDILLVEIYSIKGDIGAIQTQIEMQPKIDQQSFDGLKQQNTNCQLSNNNRFIGIESSITEVKADVKELKSKPSKRLDMIIGAIIGALAAGITNIVISNTFKW